MDTICEHPSTTKAAVERKDEKLTYVRVCDACKAQVGEPVTTADTRSGS